MTQTETLLTPKLDIIFKMLFTAEPELLADLISAVLGLSENHAEMKP